MKLNFYYNLKKAELIKKELGQSVQLESERGPFTWDYHLFILRDDLFGQVQLGCLTNSATKPILLLFLSTVSLFFEVLTLNL